MFLFLLLLLALLLLFYCIYRAYCCIYRFLPRRANQHAAEEFRQCASHEAHRAKTKCLHQRN